MVGESQQAQAHVHRVTLDAPCPTTFAISPSPRPDGAGSNGPTSRCRCCGGSASASPRTKPLRGQRLGACLHITCETANLLRALKAGGAEVLAALPIRSRPRTTSPPRWSRNTASPATRFTARIATPTTRHLRAVLESHPTITMDDGADLVSLLHTEFARPGRRGAAPAWKRPPPASSACARWRRTARSHSRWSPSTTPQTKHLFDNRYGTGQSTIDGDHARDRYLWWRARCSWSRATDGAGAVSLRARTGWAPTSS